MAEGRPTTALEHLSFRLGNQLYFVRIEDADGKLGVPGNPTGFLTIADGCKGHGCVMPMRRRGGRWAPMFHGWGLLDGRTARPVDPPALVTDELIEITDWELHDFAVQVVRHHVEELGAEIGSSTGDPNIDPSLWMHRDGRPEWIVVRAVRYPKSEPARPANLKAISEYCSRLSPHGYLAMVGVAPSDVASRPGGPSPLWRGHGYAVGFDGLKPV